MKKLCSTFAFLLLLISTASAQAITGAWYGTLDIQGTKLHIVFHIAKTADGYTSTMDSPDQGAAGLPTDKTTVTGNQLTIEAAKFGLKYVGTFMPDSALIKGTFTQGPGSLPLILSQQKPTSAAAAPPAVRPQDPTGFPYKQEEVTFTNPHGGNTLAGTLTLPANGKAKKIVVLISGSGPQNRNEEIVQFNHRPFLVWSDWLTRQGIAVLRYDDRGVGKSTGSFGKATSADFADDAEAAVAYIKSRADLKNLSVGLMGHSEGGMLAPIVASRNKAVNFIVLLAGPGVPITQLMEKQTADQLRLTPGITDSAIAITAKANAMLYAEANRYKDLSTDQFKQKMEVVLRDELRSQSGDKADSASADQFIQQNIAQMSTPWFRYFLQFTPASYLSKVACPVLAINGTLDMQVNSEANLTGIKAALQKGGNKKFEIVPMPGLNHLLQKATTGGVKEYSEISETVNPAALQKVSSWINQL